MDIFYEHFANIDGNLYHNPANDTYDMFPAETSGRTRHHINYTSFKNAFTELTAMKDPIIIETGSSRWGVNSTMLFDTYVRKYGGRFWSVDIHEPTINMLRRHVCPATTMVCDDSVSFLQKWVAEHPGEQANFVYLDSWDIDWVAPDPAEKHGLAEYHAILPALKTGSVLLIDDTPSAPYWTDSRGDNYTYLQGIMEMEGQIPGKGRLVVNEISREGCDSSWKMIHHMYQVMYKKVA